MYEFRVLRSLLQTLRRQNSKCTTTTVDTATTRLHASPDTGTHGYQNCTAHDILLGPYVTTSTISGPIAPSNM